MTIGHVVTRGYGNGTLAGDVNLVVVRGFTISTQPAAALSGTVTGATSEADIVTGGRTIVLTLTNDTWVAAGATFDAQRQNIIDGLDDSSIAAGLAATDVARTSDTVVTITMSPIPGYDIASDVVVQHTIPASALVTSASPVVAAPTFTVTAVGAKIGDGDGTSGGRYGRILPPAPPESRRGRRTPLRTSVPAPVAAPEPSEAVEPEPPLTDFSQILEALDGIKDSPLPPREAVQAILARFEPVAPSEPPTRIDLFSGLVDVQRQLSQDLSAQESRIFATLEKIHAGVRAIAQGLDEIKARHEADERLRLLVALERDEALSEQQRNRLLSLLIALADA